MYLKLILKLFFKYLDNYPGLNFAKHCFRSFGSNYTTYLKCANIATWINTCQSKGKKILLSIGGTARFNEFLGKNQAELFAKNLWNLFLGGTDVDPSLRTFGR